LVSIKTFRGKAEEGKWDGLGCYFDLSCHCQEGLFYVCCILG
jgi:hypothetical protein